MYLLEIQGRRDVAVRLLAEASFRVDAMEAIRDGSVDAWATEYMDTLDSEDRKRNATMGAMLVSRFSRMP